MRKVREYKEALFYLQALTLADSGTGPIDQSDELIQLYEPILESQQRLENEKDIRSLCTVISGQLMRPDWREYISAARRQLPPQPEGSPPLPLAEMLLETNSSHVIELMVWIKQLASEGKYRTAMEEAYHALTFAPFYRTFRWASCYLSGTLMEAESSSVANAYTSAARSASHHVAAARYQAGPLDWRARLLIIAQGAVFG